MGDQISPPCRSYLRSARAQIYLQTFFCSLAWIFVTVPKCLNQVFLQQLLLAALVACCFLRGLQAAPAYAFEKTLFHLCWWLCLTYWPGVEADANIVAHWIVSLLSYPLRALEVLWNQHRDEEMAKQRVKVRVHVHMRTRENCGFTTVHTNSSAQLFLYQWWHSTVS